MFSPSEPGRQVLIPRYASQHLDDAWHICMADSRFADGAIVTLETFCGNWCFGVLTHRNQSELRSYGAIVRFCPACETQFLQWRHLLDAHCRYLVGLDSQT